MKSTVKKFGLIGHPLTHSFSAQFFSKKFQAEAISNCSYTNYPLPNIAAFPILLKTTPQLCGLNVTIPYKEQVIPYLDELSPTARAIGAVNTISFTADRRLIGHNTDVDGFLAALTLIQILYKKLDRALVLGTGGASKAICWVLDELKIPYFMVSRSPKAGQLSYQELDAKHILEHRLIVNTTPLGMYPNINEAPNLPYTSLTADHFLYDLTYNPAETLFMKKGKAQGAGAENGLGMLKIQAEKAWEIWNN